MIQRRAAAAWLALLLSLAGAVSATWPLVTRLQTATVGKDDPWPAAWQINWLHHAFVTDPLGWNDANIFFPYENAIATSDLLLTHALVTAPAALSDSSVLAYNLALIAGIALCGLAGFLLIEELTGSTVAALLGGVVLALNPFRFLHIQHLPIAAAWPVPLLCWALVRYGATPTWGWAWAAGAAGLAACGASLYQGLYLAPFVPLVLLFGMRRWPNDAAAWGRLGTAGAGSLGALAFVALPYWEGMRTRGIPWQSSDLTTFAADLVSLGTAPPHMTGYDVESALHAEARLYPGIVLGVLGLAAVAIVTWEGWRRRSGWRWLLTAGWVGVAVGALSMTVEGDGVLRRSLEMVLLAMIWGLPAVLAAWAIARSPAEPRGPTTALRLGLAGGALAIALSFGPELHVLGEVVGPAPYRALLWITRAYEGTRVPARFGGNAVLFLSVAAGGSIAWILDRAGRRAMQPTYEDEAPGIGPPSAVLVAALSAAVLISTALELPPPGRRMTEVPDLDTPEYEWLAGIPGDFGILELPERNRQFSRPRYMLASRHHWKRLVNGTAGQIPVLVDRFYRADPWSQEFFDIIRQYLPIRFVVVHVEPLPPELRSDLLPRLATGYQGWRGVQDTDGAMVFTVDRSAERGAPGTPVERLYLRSELLPRAELRFEIRLVPGSGAANSFELLQDGEPIGSWPIEADWRELRVELEVDPMAPPGPNPWPRSTTLLSWRAQPEAAAALELRGIEVVPAGSDRSPR